MRKILVVAIILVFSSFINDGTINHFRIRWKKVKTEQQARDVMDKIILPGSGYDEDLKILSSMKNNHCSGEGDSVIYFHSKEVPVHFLSFVVRKWMYTFHFADKKMTSYEVKEGLTGP